MPDGRLVIVDRGSHSVNDNPETEMHAIASDLAENDLRKVTVDERSRFDEQRGWLIQPR
jgi:hypothetical protein